MPAVRAAQFVDEELESEWDENLTYTIRPLRAYPKRPALMNVSRRVRSEAGAIYYRENTFLFNIDRDHWDPPLRDTWNPIRDWCRLTRIDDWTQGHFAVLLEFTMGPINGHAQRAATIRFSFTTKWRLAVEVGGALKDECTCALTRKANEECFQAHVYETLHELMYDFAAHIQKEVVNNFKLADRQRGNPMTCPSCKKACLSPDYT